MQTKAYSGKTRPRRLHFRGGFFPETALALKRAACKGDGETALALSDRLEPLWALFATHGSLRVVATAAELLGHASDPCLPQPLLALQGKQRHRLRSILEVLSLG